jgi:hypothetical protein
MKKKSPGKSPKKTPGKSPKKTPKKINNFFGSTEYKYPKKIRDLSFTSSRFKKETEHLKKFREKIEKNALKCGFDFSIFQTEHEQGYDTFILWFKMRHTRKTEDETIKFLNSLGRNNIQSFNSYSK